MQLICKLQ